MALIREPLKCEVCGESIPWIPDPPAHHCSCPNCTFVGDTGGRYDYENHHCSEEAKAAFAERMKKEFGDKYPDFAKDLLALTSKTAKAG